MDFRPEFTCRNLTHLSGFVTYKNILHRDVGRAKLHHLSLLTCGNDKEGFKLSFFGDWSKLEGFRDWDGSWQKTRLIFAALLLGCIGGPFLALTVLT